MRDFIRRNHAPDIMARDVFKSGFQNNGANADLFVAGFPCQPFSAAGANSGESDCRGTIAFALVSWLEQQRPAAFVLENVAGLLHRHRLTFRKIMKKLRMIRSRKKFSNNKKSKKKTRAGYYKLHWAVLNSLDFGVPQAGMGQKKDSVSFSWCPSPHLTTVSLARIALASSSSA